MKHLNDMSGFDAAFAALVGICGGALIYPTVEPAIAWVCSALGIAR